MNKRIFNWMLMVALTMGFGTIVTSCSDDDDDEKDSRSAEEIAADPYNKESEAGNALYRLVSQLSVCDSLPDDWKTATFEPRLGKVLDQSQPRVRTIAVNDAAEAVARYNSLTGKDLPATTQSDTYKVNGVGSLTLNVGAAGTIATIDVDVKQMPKLAQLRLVSVADMGENGTFRGVPYYSFGDVVMDKDDCYWICVRPAYSPNGKEDTHWMSFQLSEKNVKIYQKKGCKEQRYPANLGVQKEKMQYLAQLMAILANPYGYKAAAPNGKFFKNKTTGLGSLRDDAMPADTLIAQAQLWEKLDIWKRIIPNRVMPTIQDVDNFKNRFKKNVRFIYEKGSTSGYNLNIPTVYYSGAASFYTTSEPTYNTVSIDMRNIEFNIYVDYAKTGERGYKEYPVEDAFVVRYKTGFQLSSNLIFSPDPTKPIEGVTEIHVFNKQKSQYVKQPLDVPVVGSILANDGNFYSTAKDIESYNALSAGVEAIGLVVHYGAAGSVETGTNYRGLAVALKRLGYRWSSTDKDVSGDCPTSKSERYWDLLDDFTGIKCTQKLAEGCGVNHKHYAAQACWFEDYMQDGVREQKGFSHWFIGSIGQWKLAVTGMGVPWSDQMKDFDSRKPDDYEGIYERAGLESNWTSSFEGAWPHYWTSSMLSDMPDRAYGIAFNPSGHIGFSYMLKTTSYCVRPFIAF